MSLDNMLDAQNLRKLQLLNNPYVNKVVEEYIKLCKPSKVTVLTDSPQDIDYIRELAINNGEEAKLGMEGHTIHYDGPKDQGRDLENTRVLVPPGVKLSRAIRIKDREEGLKEINGLLNGIMKGKEMFISFYCLGPADSPFSIPALQISDSAYVLHSENILYRQGYGEFKRLKGSDSFFHFIHSAGRIDGSVSADVDKRRVYMDLEKERVFTINNQYAGNSVGLKKLALRLAISKANREGWLCEHMFLMGIQNQEKGRTTYATGAFPTACGKTSTAMVPGQTIIGDDIAYLRINEEGVAMAVNVEQGIFGIIQDINEIDDPSIWELLTTEREVIFSNVLVNGGKPYWLGMKKPAPESGINFSGQWHKGKTDASGKEIPLAHPNARYTVRIEELPNADTNLNNPSGVPVDLMIYGGRDCDTSVPVRQSLNWAHGVFLGAALESETTTGTTDAAGVKKHNPMSNIEFLTVPLSVYMNSHLEFGAMADTPPLIFSTNYFLKDEAGKFLNSKLDKKVWLMWMEGRVHEEYGAIKTPIGFIPKYDDLRALFLKIFNKEYTREDYEKQFSIRLDKVLEKLDRIEAIFRSEENIPNLFYYHLNQQRRILKKSIEKHQKGIVSPFEFVQ